MAAELASLKTEVQHLRTDVNSKHSQNRKDIHDLRSGQQDISDSIWTLRLTVAKWSGGAVVICYVAVHYLDKLWK